MNKTEMIAAIADKTGLTKRESEKALKADRALILACDDPEAAKKALAVAKDSKPILLGANAANADRRIATKTGFLCAIFSTTVIPRFPPFVS